MSTDAKTLLKFANLQMAAEAVDLSAGITGNDYTAALVKGNNSSSKFTDVQAAEFAANWEVVEHKSNTATGFSGTLFRYTGATDLSKGLTHGELVLSFRSTEFNDDAARDNQATNTMEIKPYGWAFGQIADMEAWYAELNASGSKLGNKSYSVTGYSLGGHLATAFNLLRKEDGSQHRITSTHTFNGAGVGEISQGGLVQTIQANSLLAPPDSLSLHAPFKQQLRNHLSFTTNSIAYYADNTPAKCSKRFKNRRKSYLQHCSYRKYKPNWQIPGIEPAQSATEFVVTQTSMHLASEVQHG